MNETEKEHFPFTMEGFASEYHANIKNVNLEVELRPETELEQKLLEDPAFLKGLHWGVPRYGHPEGEVYKHVREVLDNIDRLELEASVRQDLRLITFVHDTFKYLEDKSKPRDWTKHHGILARRFMEKYLRNDVLLNIIEHHDEAYFSWRYIHLFKSPTEGTHRMNQLLETLGDNLQLYYLFFKCDTRTGDKNLAPLVWFEKLVKDIDIIEF